MKDIKFIVGVLVSNLASFAVTQYVVLEAWNHIQFIGGPASLLRRRSLQEDCCNCETRVCNGLASNCNRAANEIMYATMHNAMSSRDEGFIVPNHSTRLEKALDAGFRGLFLDSCDCDGTEFCHGFCFSGTRNAKTVFDSIVTFLKGNPNEIVVLELQIDDDTLLSLWDSASPEFRSFLYSHPDTSTPWPTLNDLIDLQKRLIVFQHNGGNCDAQGQCPAGIHDMWDFGFETSFELEGADELKDYSKSCTIQTGQASNQWFVNNHFAGNNIGLPSSNIARDVNTAQVLQARLDACETMLGSQTNLLVVDFWSVGDVMQVVMDNNAALGDDRNALNTNKVDGEESQTETESDTNIFGSRFGDAFNDD